MLNYGINCPVTPRQISELRKTVGWNGMLDSYEKSLKTSSLYVCCFDGDRLVGFLDVVSNGVTDAYIQDVVVAPDRQGMGCGTRLMKTAIETLKD